MNNTSNYSEWYGTYKSLKRKKVGQSAYDIVLRTDGQTVIGNAVKTGSHLDDYSWEWSYHTQIINNQHCRVQGSAATLDDYMQHIASCLQHDTNNTQLNK